MPALALAAVDRYASGVLGTGPTMAKTRGTGLPMAWTVVDPEFEAEFNRWYDEEHVTRLLEVPGFLSAGRVCRRQRRAEISRHVRAR